MLQHLKGKVPYSIKTINSCVVDAEMDSFEDLRWKKNWANKNGL